jgi:hypothetical protein
MAAQLYLTTCTPHPSHKSISLCLYHVPKIEEKNEIDQKDWNVATNRFATTLCNIHLLLHKVHL